MGNATRPRYAYILTDTKPRMASKPRVSHTLHRLRSLLCCFGVGPRHMDHKGATTENDLEVVEANKWKKNE